jgi:RNA polymerase sigma-70 factor (ECF subfamily)
MQGDLKSTGRRFMTESGNGLISENNDSASDEIKLIRAARQDPKAFGELYLRYARPVFRYLCSRIGNVHEAEDITAQTFLAAFESFDGFQQDKHFASWLFTIARNKAMDHFRQRKDTTPIDEIREIPSESDPMNGVIQSEQAAALSKLIRALTEEDRELLRLRFLAAMSFPEMAHFLHRNEEAVKKTVYRLLERLHHQLEVSND